MHLSFNLSCIAVVKRRWLRAWHGSDHTMEPVAAQQSFRCYLLDRQQAIIAGDDVSAADLFAAIDRAWKMLADHNTRLTIKASGVEIWQGTTRLYSKHRKPGS